MEAWEVVVVDPNAEITTSMGEFTDHKDAILAREAAQEEIDEDPSADGVYVEMRPIR